MRCGIASGAVPDLRAGPDFWNARRSDHLVVRPTDGAPASAAGQPDAGPYGLPAALFRRLWSIDDICTFCGVERTKARQLMSVDGAPPKMRMASARCDRWNPVQVVMWLHGDDWRTGPAPLPSSSPGVRQLPRFPGVAWAPGDGT